MTETKELEQNEFDIPLKPIVRIADKKDISIHQKNISFK